MSQKSLGYAQTTDVATAKTVAEIAPSGTIPPTATHAIVQCEAQNCRWTDDGTTTPTASVGMILAVGDILTVSKAQFTKFKIIQAAASAKVNATFYKTG